MPGGLPHDRRLAICPTVQPLAPPWDGEALSRTPEKHKWRPSPAAFVFPPMSHLPPPACPTRPSRGSITACAPSALMQNALAIAPRLVQHRVVVCAYGTLRTLTVFAAYVSFCDIAFRQSSSRFL